MYFAEWDRGTMNPLCAAQDMGLDQEYQTLSDRLLKNIRLAILYAINE